MKVKHKPEKTILQIRPNKKQVILIGRGPSVDNLDLKALNHQSSYNICTISDAIKIVDRPTFAFQYHYRGILRCQNECEKAQFLLVPYKVKTDLDRRGFSQVREMLQETLDNVYWFQSNHVKWSIIAKGEFDREFKKAQLQNHEGSVVGAIHFLCGLMGVKKIRYIGFDGGEQPGVASYGKLVHAGRKGPKIAGAAKDYEKSWGAVLKMLEYYPDVSFKPLKEFLIDRS